MDDRRLAEKARLGDVDAYEQLVHANQQLAFRVAYSITRDVAEAEDAIQESFVKAYYALDRFDPGAPFRPWLLRIVTNEALNRQRSVQRRGDLAARAATLDSGSENIASDSPDPEAAALASERREFVLRAIECLDEADRVVLTYRYLLDLSVAEIAGILAIPQRTVRSRIARAMERLRKQIAVEVDSPAETRSPGGRP